MTYHLPKISILVPARNEEENLPVLLRSLEKLNYPKEKTEILLGNDGSEDQTGGLMEEFAARYAIPKDGAGCSADSEGLASGLRGEFASRYTAATEDSTDSEDRTTGLKEKPGRNRATVRVVHLREEAGHPLSGKTRVLAELADRATGEYLFFTDADIELPANWISGMLAGFDPDTGVVVGATGFRRSTPGAALQGIEWLMALSIFKIAADRGRPSTGLGNNMAVSRKAYDAVGGYQTLGFSIVEDYFLYKKIIEAGFGFRHLLSADILSFTVPPRRYFEQRRRWIKGAMENAPAAMTGGILQALCIPLLFLLGLINPVIPAVVSGILVLINAGLIVYFQRKLRITGYLRYLPLFTVYISTAWMMQFIYYLLSRQTIWKGRKY